MSTEMEVVMQQITDIRNEIRNSVESRNSLLQEIRKQLVSLSEVTLGRGGETSKAALGEESSAGARVRKLVEMLTNYGRELLVLEDREKLICEEFNKVMSTLSMLPVCVISVSTGVSGFLSSDPQDCRMLILIAPVVLCLVAAIFLALFFAHQQLQRLKQKSTKLFTSRKQLYDRVVEAKGSYPEIAQGGTVMEAIVQFQDVMEKMADFQEVNVDLKFQACWFEKYLWLIGLCGLLYAAMVLIAGCHVVCKSKEIPLDPVVPGHLPFSPRVPSLRQYQDM